MACLSCSRPTPRTCTTPPTCMVCGLTIPAQLAPMSGTVRPFQSSAKPSLLTVGHGKKFIHIYIHRADIFWINVNLHFKENQTIKILNARYDQIFLVKLYCQYKFMFSDIIFTKNTSFSFSVYFVCNTYMITIFAIQVLVVLATLVSMEIESPLSGSTSSSAMMRTCISLPFQRTKTRLVPTYKRQESN